VVFSAVVVVIFASGVVIAIGSGDLANILVFAAASSGAVV
jgi:hypothetical protein